MKAQLMVGMLLSLFIALALAAFIASLAVQARSGSAGAEAQLNRTVGSLTSHILSLRNSV